MPRILFAALLAGVLFAAALSGLLAAPRTALPLPAVTPVPTSYYYPPMPTRTPVPPTAPVVCLAPCR